MNRIEAKKTAAVKSSSDNPAYKVYVKLPEGKEAIEYETLEKVLIKAVYNKNGISLSRAALEELAAKHKLDFTASYDYQRKEYVFNAKDGLMINPKTVTVNGKTFKGYELTIPAELEKTLLKDSALAQEITKSGKKAFSELTMEERLKMMTARTGKYLPQDLAESLKEIDPRMLVAGAMTGAAAAALVKKVLFLQAV